MLARLRNAIYGWLMAWLAPLYDPHGRPDAAAEPKPYMPADKAKDAAIGQLKAYVKRLEDENSALRAKVDAAREALA